MDNKEYIRDIQLAGLSTLHKFDSICRKYGVTYFAVSGTLLGAIRHHGYIPWDDDMDIGILREDFDKLINIPEYEWGDEIELITAANDNIIHDKIFPRIYLRNSRIQSYKDVRHWKNPNDKKTWFTSLMIDLFIFDEIPDDDSEYHKIWKKIQKIRDKYKLVKLEPNIIGTSWPIKVKAIMKYIYGTLARSIYEKPWKRLNDRYLSIVEKAPKGKRIGCYYSTFRDIVVKKKDIFPIGYTEFEDMLIPIPNNYKELLELNYGKTYMEYPPESKRYHISFIFADLGDGKIFNIDPIPGSLGEEYIKANI